jgi:hypothetical protein
MSYGSKHSSNKRGEQRGGGGDNPIATKPVRAMGLPAFLGVVFMPRHCFALCHPTFAVRAGEHSKIDA